jgi:hypothetical protein
MKYGQYKEFKYPLEGKFRVHVMLFEDIKSLFKVTEGRTHFNITHSTGEGGGLEIQKHDIWKIFGREITVKYERTNYSRVMFQHNLPKDRTQTIYAEWCSYICEPTETILPDNLFDI